MRAWRKSSHSETSGATDCVEVASLGAAVGIRDSKNAEAGHLTVSRRGLARLVALVKAGDLDLA